MLVLGMRRPIVAQCYAALPMLTIKYFKFKGRATVLAHCVIMARTLNIIHTHQLKLRPVFLLAAWIISLLAVYKWSSGECYNTSYGSLQSDNTSKTRSKLYIEHGYSFVVCIKKKSDRCRNGSSRLR